MSSKSNSIFRLMLELRAKHHKRVIRRDENSNAILIIATLFLGDLFMIAPLISNLKTKYPSKKIVLVCREELAGVACYLGVNHIIPSLKPSKSAINTIKSLNQGGPYSVFCLFSGRWLPAMVNLNVVEVLSFYEPANRWNHLITDEIPFPDVPTPAVEIPMLMLGDRDYIKCMPPIDLWSPTEKKVVIHVGARSELRRMPMYLITHLVKTLSVKKIKIVISAGPNEFNHYRELENLLPKEVYRDIVFELGSKTIDEFVSIINSANLVVGIDTGVIHMSKVMGTPTLVLMGQSEPYIFGGDNLFSRSIHLGVDNLDCRDKKSFQGIKKDWINRCDRNTCPLSDVLCIQNINTELIDQSIDQLLKLSLNTPPLD